MKREDKYAVCSTNESANQPNSVLLQIVNIFTSSEYLCLSLKNIFFYLLKTHCYLKNELCFKNHTGDLFEPQCGIPHRATSDTESCHEFASEF